MRRKQRKGGRQAAPRHHQQHRWARRWRSRHANGVGGAGFRAADRPGRRSGACRPRQNPPLAPNPRSWKLITEGPDRVDAPCPHFGACGGCQLQHWSLGAQQDWKLTRIEEAVSRAGFDPALVLPLESVETGTRRRAEFVALQPTGKPVQIGFRRRSSHWVEVVESCLVLRPALIAALAAAARRDWMG